MATRPPIPDYYTLLGVKPTANALEIQRSYRKLARAWRRPGKTGVGVLAMAAIDEAYDTLKDIEKKTYYDCEYPRIRVAWKAYQKRRTIAAQADDDVISIDSSDADADDEDGDDTDDTDDGGPDGEAVDEEYTDRELSDDEEEPSSQAAKGPGHGHKTVIAIDSEDEAKEKSEEESEAEFTDGEEPVSDDDRPDERVDRYAHFCTGYAADSESDDDETRYATRLRNGAWVERDQHYQDDPKHRTCDLEEY